MRSLLLAATLALSMGILACESGPARHFELDTNPQCPNCHGSGSFKCSKCMGRGQAPCTAYGCSFGKTQCGGCNGTGKNMYNPKLTCTSCSGVGKS